MYIFTTAPLNEKFSQNKIFKMIMFLQILCIISYVISLFPPPSSFPSLPSLFPSFLLFPF